VLLESQIPQLDWQEKQGRNTHFWMSRIVEDFLSHLSNRALKSANASAVPTSQTTAITCP
jgi:hypothetical protein